MCSNGEIIEKLARQLEHQIIYCDLKECKSFEDFWTLVEKYRTICENQK